MNKPDKVRPSDDPADIEAPHTVFPLWRAMDKVYVSPAGETPPKIGTELPETDEDRADRRAGRSPDPVYNTTDTYTFSFHNPYTDFTKWELQALPTGPLSLLLFVPIRTFR